MAKNQQCVTLSVMLQANDCSSAQSLFSSNVVSSRANSAGACVSTPDECPAWVKGRVNMPQPALRRRLVSGILGRRATGRYAASAAAGGDPVGQPAEVVVNAGILGSSLISFSSNVATLTIWPSANGAPETLFAANIAAKNPAVRQYCRGSDLSLSRRGHRHCQSGSVGIPAATGLGHRAIAPSVCNGNGKHSPHPILAQRAAFLAMSQIGSSAS